MKWVKRCNHSITRSPFHEFTDFSCEELNGPIWPCRIRFLTLKDPIHKPWTYLEYIYWFEELNGLGVEISATSFVPEINKKSYPLSLYLWMPLASSLHYQMVVSITNKSVTYRLLVHFLQQFIHQLNTLTISEIT